MNQNKSAVDLNSSSFEPNLPHIKSALIMLDN